MRSKLILFFILVFAIPTLSQDVTVTRVRVWDGTTQASVNSGGGFNVNMFSYAGNTLTGTVTAYGVAPTGNVFGVNAFITNTVPVTLTSTTVTGTVAVTQSTSPWVVSLTSTTITGTVAVTQSTSPWVTSVTAWGGGTLGAMATYGTTPGAVLVPGVNAFITNTVPVTLTSTTITGTVAVTQSTSPWVVSCTAANCSVNLAQMNAVALGSPSAYGTSPGAVNVQGVNAFITNTVPVTLTSTTITGTVAGNITQIAGTTLGATAVTNFGTAPAAAAVPGVNASIYAGTTGITATGTSLNINCTAGCGGASSFLDNAAFTAGTTPVNITGGWYATSPTACTTGSACAPSLTVDRKLFVNAFQATSPWVVSLASTTITGTVAVTQSTSPWVVSLTSTTITGTVSVVGATTPADAQANPTTAVVTQAFNMVWNGTTWDRMSEGFNNADAEAVETTGVQEAQTYGYGFNGTTWDRLRTVASSGNGLGMAKVGISGNTGATIDATAAAGTAPTNGVLGLGIFNTTLPAPTAGQSVALQVDTNGSLWVNTEGRKATYAMSSVAFTPVASATSPFWSIQGSASKTIRINRIVVTMSAITGTATPFAETLALQKYSVLTGGTTGTTPTGALNDSNNAAQTAVVLTYSAVPTTATAIGGVTRAELIQTITSSATAYGVTRNEWDFGDKSNQSLVLRGTAQYFGIHIAALGTTPIATVWVEWVEDNS